MKMFKQMTAAAMLSRRHGNVGSIVTYSHSSEAFDPTDGACDDPTHSAQMAPVLLVAFANVRFNAQPAEYGSRGFAVVTRVGIKILGMRRRTSHFARHGRIRNDRRKDLQLIAAIGRRSAYHQRNAIAIDHECVFRPFFPAVHGAGARLVATAKTRTCVESTIVVSACNSFACRSLVNSIL